MAGLAVTNLGHGAESESKIRLGVHGEICSNFAQILPFQLIIFPEVTRENLRGLHFDLDGVWQRDHMD